MNFKQVDPNDLKYFRKTKLFKFIESFAEAGIPVAEVTDWKDEYASISSCSGAINGAAKRFSKYSIICKVINRKVYIINKSMLGEEYSLGGKEK